MSVPCGFIPRVRRIRSARSAVGALTNSQSIFLLERLLAITVGRKPLTKVILRVNQKQK